MLPSRFVTLYLLVVCFLIYCEAFEPFLTLGISGIALGVAWWQRKNIKDNTYCKFNQCCTKKKFNVTELEDNLKTHVYGQHIVGEEVVRAIGAHLNSNETSEKPLVMSFQGPSGTGKNFVSDFVAKALYQEGFDSRHVKKFTASDMPQDLAEIVRKTVKYCRYSLFIFDEIEKMPKNAFDSIVALLDHHSSQKGYDFTKAIFIFLSNGGANKIAEKLKSLIDKGLWRRNTKLEDFEEIARLGAFNVGGLYNSKVISSNVIDYFIPFLPLEPRHVEQCIKKEFEKQNCSSKLNDDSVRDILKQVMTDDNTGMFSFSGCKRLNKRVEAYCYIRV